MKTRIAVFMLMLMSVFNLNAQKSTSGHTEERSTKPFHHIKIEGEMKVTLIHDEKPSVIIDGNDFQLSNTITMLRSDTLFVYQTNVRKSGGKVKLVVYATDVESLDVSGKSTVDISGFNKQYLGIRITDGAEVRLKSSDKEKSVAFKNVIYTQAAYYARWTPVMDLGIIE